MESDSGVRLDAGVGAGDGQGAACSDAGACKTGHCVDGVCCDEACDGECRSCNQAGKLGTCSDVPLASPDLYKVGGMTVNYKVGGMTVNCATKDGFACDGMGSCKLRGGVSCNGNASACASGACATTCAWVEGEACSKPEHCLPSLTCSLGSCR